MFRLFASIFGYLLEVLYSLVNNYGLAIIIFTVVIKLILLPLSIKQQRTMKKSAKIQEKMKVIQFKYKNDQQKMNEEIMNLYKEEKMSPFGGCLTAIVQMILLLSIFYLVRSPLTFMQKVPQENINTYISQLKEEGKTVSDVYPEIDLIRESETLIQKNPEDENAKKLDIKMNFLELDLSKIPQQNLTDYKVYIIPVLYILSSFISIRLTTKMQENLNKQNKSKDPTDPIIMNDDKKEEKEKPQEQGNEMDAVMQTNKMMSWTMPILSISIALVAPLGLALYWLMNNILMIIERIVLDKMIKEEEEA